MKTPRSLAGRLTLALVAATTALIGGGQVFVAAAASRALGAEFDRSLLDKARNLAMLVEQERGRVEFDYVPRFHPDFERDTLPDYFQVSMADGEVLLRSRHLSQDLVFDARNEPWYGDAVLSDGRAVRHVVYPFTADLGGKAGNKKKAARPSAEATPEVPHAMVFVVLRGTERLMAARASLRTTTLVVLGIAIAFGVLVFRWLVRRGLAPVRSIADQVQALDVDAADRRVTLRDAPSELLPVVEQTNALLARLHAALDRERSFTGNIAHELRTPVAELRALADVARRWPDDQQNVARFFGDVRAVSERMGRVIADLLLLARCQGGVERCQLREVVLLPALHESLRRISVLVRGQAVDVEVPKTCAVVTDAGKFGIVLDNLLSNAFAHALAGSRVRVTAGLAGDRCWLEIHNAARPLAATQLAHLAEPFWRAEASRSSGEHAGLGLAIVRALAALLELRVDWHQLPDGTFVARVEARAATFANHARAMPAAAAPPTFPESA